MSIKRKVLWISVLELLVDLKYQRPLKLAWTRRLASEWNDDVGSLFYVSERDSGERYILDGQQRQEALRLRGTPETKVQSVVYTGLTREEEALLFQILNQDKDLTPLDLYHAAVTAKDPEAMGIRRVVQGLGLRVRREPRGGQPRSIGAIQICRTAYRLDGVGAFLKEALVTIGAAYGDGAYPGFLILGLADVYADHPDWDRARMTERLAGHPGGWPKLDADAKYLTSLPGANGLRYRQAVKQTLEGLYTRRKRRG